MNFIIEDTLKVHMQHTGKNHIVLELVTVETSDIEISELYVHLIDDRQAKIFKEKKKYRSFEVETGEVLLPKFPLRCDEEVHFWLKRFWCFKSVGYSGIKI